MIENNFVLFSPSLAFNIEPNLILKYYFSTYLGHAYSNNKDFLPWHCRKFGKKRSITTTHRSSNQKAFLPDPDPLTEFFS